MIWGCTTSKGLGKLVLIKQKLDKYFYKSILIQNLRSSAVQMGIENDFVPQQDNVPKHTPHYVSTFFAEKDINALECPPHSPGSSPIEHLWVYIKCEVIKTKPKNLRELESKVTEVWSIIMPEFCEEPSGTLDVRVGCVLKAKGKHIPF